jgi:CheY-like chemotaxis protein
MTNISLDDTGCDTRQRILVADDDPDILLLNKEVLLDCGYLVDAMKDGAAAWEALQLAKYDLVVTDHTMPGLTGVQLIEKIHAAEMALPVIMASGALPVWEFALQPELQPVAVLLKPYTIAELVGTVKDALQASFFTGTKAASRLVWQRQPLPHRLLLR